MVCFNVFTEHRGQMQSACKLTGFRENIGADWLILNKLSAAKHFPNNILEQEHKPGFLDHLRITLQTGYHLQHGGFFFGTS